NEIEWIAATRPYRTARPSTSSIGAPTCRRRTEVRLDDFRVTPDIRGRALRDCLSVVEHLDPFAESEDQRHVVLDDEQAELEVRRKRRQGSDQRLGFRFVQAGGGLVEK